METETLTTTRKTNRLTDQSETIQNFGNAAIGGDSPPARTGIRYEVELRFEKPWHAADDRYFLT
jgi:hypothetical protein